MTNLPAFDSYIGRRTTATDMATVGPIARLAATLGVQQPASAVGDPIPPGWHSVYFGPALRQDHLRADGQAGGGASLPSVPLPRYRVGRDRMDFPGAIRIGDQIKRTAEITHISADVSPKNRILRIVHRSEISGPDGVAVVEERESLYCETHVATAPEASLPSPAWQRVVTPDPILLFRFSALRFNSHRVHYDRDFAIREEGLPGLMVQAALVGQLLIEMCRNACPTRQISNVSLRTHSPIYDTGPFTLCGAPVDSSGDSAFVWAVDSDLATGLTGRVTFSAQPA